MNVAELLPTAAAAASAVPGTAPISNDGPSTTPTSAASSAVSSSSAASSGSRALRLDVMAWAQGMDEDALLAQHDALAALHDQLKDRTSAVGKLQSELSVFYDMLDLDDDAIAKRLQSLRDGVELKDIKSKERDFTKAYEPLREFRKQLATALGVTAAPAAAAAAPAIALSLSLPATGGAGTAASSTTGSGSGTLKPFIGRVRATAVGCSKAIWSVVPLPGQAKVACGCWDSNVRIFPIPPPSASGAAPVVVSPLLTLSGHTSNVDPIAVMPNGTIVSGAETSDCYIRQWDVSGAGRCVASKRAHTRAVFTLIVVRTPDGPRLVSSGDEKVLKIHNIDTLEVERTLSGHTDAVLGATQLLDGRLLTVAYDGTIQAWTPGTWSRTTLYSGRPWIRCITALPDGNAAFGTTDDAKVHILDTATGRIIRTLSGHADWIRALAVIGDGSRLVSVSRSGQCRVWNWSTGECTHSFEHSEGLYAVAPLPDGGFVASSDGGPSGAKLYFYE